MCLIGIDDDLVKHRAQDTFPQIVGGLRMMPHGWEIVAELEQVLPLLGGEDRLRAGERGEILLELADAGEGVVPPAFEFAGDQPVVRVNSVVLALGTLRLVARFLQGQLQGPTLVGVRVRQLVDRGERGIDPRRLHRVQHLRRHGLFNGHAAQRQTGRRAALGTAACTRITRNPSAPPTIGDEQLAPAAPTAQQAGQQCWPSFRSAAGRASLSGQVRLQDALVLKILVPRNVPRMVVADQDVPLLRRLPPSG